MSVVLVNIQHFTPFVYLSTAMRKFIYSAAKKGGGGGEKEGTLVKCVTNFRQICNQEFWTICQLATCDDRRPRTGLGLPPYVLITHSVKRRQSVELGHTWGLLLSRSPGPAFTEKGLKKSADVPDRLGSFRADTENEGLTRSSDGQKVIHLPSYGTADRKNVPIDRVGKACNSTDR
ncbi:hypothetical protein TNCV_1399591 [Trichonephila clavipes]|nr:hypothetical protein TNCV_1399591 [Trichonephila clavipes]